MNRDESGKYIYYDVVMNSQVPSDSLRSRVVAFLIIKKLKELKNKTERITASGKFLINKTAFVLTHPSGEVKYNFALEIKENRYRFWLTNFVFIPYQRDRYANFVPSTVKGIPLESNPGKLNSAEWSSYIEVTENHAQAFAVEFKNFLILKPKSKTQTNPKPSITTKDW